jgi:hypothetical protein
MTADTDNVIVPPSFAERRHLDEITAQAHQVQPGRVILAVIASFFFLIGWLTAKFFTVLFFSGAWCAVAVRTGWREARGTPLTQPALEQVLAENAQLRAELARVT